MVYYARLITPTKIHYGAGNTEGRAVFCTMKSLVDGVSCPDAVAALVQKYLPDVETFHTKYSRPIWLLPPITRQEEIRQ